MELERISVVLRPRGPREAIDLGAAMLRANAAAVWSAWFAFTLPVFVLCNALGVLLGLPWLGLVLMWWLKPLFDRVPLYVLSRAVFERTPGWRETLRGQRQWRWRSTLAALSWLRVDSNRALRLPMELLEGAPRKQRVARWKVLRRRIVADTSLLTYGCLQFELVLFLSVWLLALLLIPDEWRPLSLAEFFRHDVRDASTVWILLGAAVAYLAMSAIEPLYVACGFALYLNRRTQLEAWDIDLAFRRLRTRLQGLGKLLGVVLACACAWPMPAQAAAPPKPAATSLQQVFRQPPDSAGQRFAAAAMQAYRDPRFGGEHTVRRWVFKYTPKPTPAAQAIPFPALGAALATVFKIFLWLALVVAIGALLRFAWRWRGRLLQASAEPPLAVALDRQPTVVADAPLPADLAGATRALWHAQRQREALALLYRGCVAQTSRLLKVAPSPDATEADWLRRAAAIDDPARAQRIIAIVRTWQFAAYAGRYPDDAGIERLLAGWPAQAGTQA
ncbi:DUF4129 domain-containing protein [Rhodanobacter umsongensis]|uniref:DUF4129 domain-containing protein n=1 Tax=Rhodanobacter umsongensis TaxID=633153 RepID=A0ABW0JMF9_9GAMM